MAEGAPARRLRRRGRGHHRHRGPRRRHRGEAGRARVRRHRAARRARGCGAPSSPAAASACASRRRRSPSRCCAAGCWAFPRCERGGPRPRVRRPRARRRPARGDRRPAGAPAPAARGGPARAARGHPPHPALPRRRARRRRSTRCAPLLAAAAAACPPAEAQVAGLGTFPERGSPRVLWLGLAVPAAILDLQRACERAARAAGFEREERPFRAHLTLGRWRDRAPRPELPPADLGTTPPRHARPLPERPAAGRRRLHGARAVRAGPPGGRLGARCSPLSRSSPSPT